MGENEDRIRFRQKDVDKLSTLNWSTFLAYFIKSMKKTFDYETLFNAYFPQR